MFVRTATSKDLSSLPRRHKYWCSARSTRLGVAGTAAPGFAVRRGLGAGFPVSDSASSMKCWASQHSTTCAGLQRSCLNTACRTLSRVFFSALRNSPASTQSCLPWRTRPAALPLAAPKCQRSIPPTRCPCESALCVRSGRGALSLRWDLPQLRPPCPRDPKRPRSGSKLQWTLSRGCPRRRRRQSPRRAPPPRPRRTAPQLRRRGLLARYAPHVGGCCWKPTPRAPQLRRSWLVRGWATPGGAPPVAAGKRALQPPLAAEPLGGAASASGLWQPAAGRGPAHQHHAARGPASPPGRGGGGARGAWSPNGCSGGRVEAGRRDVGWSSDGRDGKGQQDGGAPGWVSSGVRKGNENDNGSEQDDDDDN